MEKYTNIKFDTTNKSYTFKTDLENIHIDDKVVVETNRGVELGVCVSELSDTHNLQEGMEIKPILRKASYFDIKNFERNRKDAKSAMAICQREADKLKLQMNVISAEYTLDRAKITFIYVADDRVDFRELLKVLAAIFKCRIDLRQIGARDKAKMIGGIGSCGRELCCRGFINSFDMVSINMAKNQGLALNIAKLSGHCGKLMCCLKYEDEIYSSIKSKLPKLNAQVTYNKEQYRFTGVNVLTGICHLENPNSSLNVTIDELVKKGRYKAIEAKDNEVAENEIVNE